MPEGIWPEDLVWDPMTWVLTWPYEMQDLALEGWSIKMSSQLNIDARGSLRV